MLGDSFNHSLRNKEKIKKNLFTHSYTANESSDLIFEKIKSSNFFVIDLLNYRSIESQYSIKVQDFINTINILVDTDNIEIKPFIGSSISIQMKDSS